MALSSETIVALNRFGLGVRYAEDMPANPGNWLLGQLEKYNPYPHSLSEIQDSATLIIRYAEALAAARELDPGARATARMEARKWAQDVYLSEIDMRARTALTTSTPFIERLVHFWSNHFAISADSAQITLIAGAFEREAIRPHVLGSFHDLLLAVERHPAMLIYLDQRQSTGPNSQFNRNRPRPLGINENLAREILELHTLGVRSGYDQADVTEFALALTGFDVGRPHDGDEYGAFVFRSHRHEPGERQVLGRTYAQSGEQQALAVLGDIAMADATATHIATKLARHFIADDPPADAVASLADAFRRSDGNLVTVYRELINNKAAWQPDPVKFKTPWEWTISAMRGLGLDDIDRPRIAQVAAQLGQPLWRPRSPAGYDDVSESWAAPDALVRRVEAAQVLAAKVDGIDPRELSQKLFAGTLSEVTATEVARAESVRTGIALLLASPDFQRR